MGGGEEKREQTDGGRKGKGNLHHRPVASPLGEDTLFILTESSLNTVHCVMKEHFLSC